MVTTGAMRHAKIQSKCYHQETYTQFFTGRVRLMSPNQQCQSTEGKQHPCNNERVLFVYCCLCEQLDDASEWIRNGEISAVRAQLYMKLDQLDLAQQV